MNEKILLSPRVVKYILRDDGNFPNNSELPVLIYKQVLDLPERKLRAAAIVEDVFAENDWKNSWRDGIFKYHHYHSNTHEVMGVFRGSAEVQLGGPDGPITVVHKGDVIVLPAGATHKCLRAHDFKCVGAYPDGAQFDMNYGKPGEREKTMDNISKTALPDKDPVFGNKGPLWEHWWYRIRILNHIPSQHTRSALR